MGPQAFEQLFEELLRHLLVPPTLPQDIKGIVVLIHGSPQVVALIVEGQKHFVKNH